MCATTAKPALHVTFVRNPFTDSVFPGCVTGPVTIGRDLYALKAEKLPTGWRAEFLKVGGGSSTVRASAGAEICTCKGFHFSKGRGCRHLAAFHAIEADLLAEPGDDREAVIDEDARMEEMDSFYANTFDWE